MKKLIFTLFSLTFLYHGMVQAQCPVSFSPAPAPLGANCGVLNFATVAAANAFLTPNNQLPILNSNNGNTINTTYSGFSGPFGLVYCRDNANTIFPLNLTGSFANCNYVNGSSAPLPIELVGFRAELRSKDAFLTWATATERNNYYFNIERSFNGKDFESIASMAGKGNSSETAYYQFLDKNLSQQAASNKIYYRLRQTDFDRQTTVSEIVVLEMKYKSGQLELGTVLAMDAYDEVRVRFVTPEAGNIQSVLFDLSGRVLQTRQIEAAEGINEMKIDLTEQYKGVYILSLNDGRQIVTTKILRP